MMSSQTLLGNKTLYYKLELLTTVTDADRNDKNVYVNGDRAIKRTEVDGLYLTEAVHTDEDGNKTTYFFDGEGNMSVDGEVVYTYVIKGYNSNSTATLQITKDVVTYTATLDYSNSNDITLEIGDIIEDEEMPENNENA